MRRSVTSSPTRSTASRVPAGAGTPAFRARAIWFRFTPDPVELGKLGRTESADGRDPHWPTQHDLPHEGGCGQPGRLGSLVELDALGRRDAYASFRPLSALKRRPPARGPCYRGSISWRPGGGTGKTVVWRPDWSTRLEPLPVEFVEEELIRLRFKP